METKTKPYAIRCSTEEEARECSNKGFTAIINGTVNMCENITYEEAKEMGLLGEKCKHIRYNSPQAGYICQKCGEPQQNEVQESPSEDNLVEFAIRLKERFPSTPIKEILIEVKQHLLSSK